MKISDYSFFSKKILAQANETDPFRHYIQQMNGSSVSVFVAPLSVQVLLSTLNSAHAKAFPPIGFRVKGVNYNLKI